MAKVRVGVKRIRNGIEVHETDETGAGDGVFEVFQQWIEINGVRFDTGDVGLLGVTYGLGHSEYLRDSDGGVIRGEDGQPITEYRNGLMGEVTMVFASSAFETVDHREPPPDGD